MQNKFEKLQEYLTELKKQGICLAFSGGIDSMLLLYLCKKTDARFIAITFKSGFQSDDETDLTTKLCKEYNVKQIITEYDILSNPVITNNPKDRCYHCKKIMFSKAMEIARLNNLKNIIDGTNFDDLHQYRPGLKALSELNIISPLAKFEITKAEIRKFAKINGIELYNKPSTPCLATRFPYGTKLNKQNIDTVYKGEKILTQYGFSEHRLRLHDNLARIEIPDSKFKDFLNNKNAITKSLKKLGISYITLDIQGLRKGSMDI